MPFKHISRNSVPEHVRHAQTLLSQILKWSSNIRSCGNGNHPMRGRRWIILLSTLPAIRMFSRTTSTLESIPTSHLSFQMTFRHGPSASCHSSRSTLYLSPIMSAGLDAHQIANGVSGSSKFAYPRIGNHAHYRG